MLKTCQFLVRRYTFRGSFGFTSCCLGSLPILYPSSTPRPIDIDFGKQNRLFASIAVTPLNLPPPTLDQCIVSMLQDYPTTKSAKRCSLSGDEFSPGESYISVLIPQGDEISRMDISAKHWNQPPENAIGWWKCRMPDAQRRGSRPAPSSVLLDTLAELLQRPDKADLAYLLALLLVRRRVLVEEQQLELDDEQSPNDFWNLIQPADGRQWQVPLRNPEAAELARLQDSLIKLLFTDE